MNGTRLADDQLEPAGWKVPQPHTMDYIAWYNGTRAAQRPWLHDPDEFETTTRKEALTQVA